MAILKNRYKTNSNLIDLSKFVVFLLQKFTAVLLIILSSCLIYFSVPQKISSTILQIFGKTLSAGSLIYQGSIEVMQWTNSRLSYFKNLEAENLRLKLELSSLHNIKATASNLHIENQSLKKILNAAKSIKYNFISAKIIGTTITPFTNSMITQAGSENNIQVNNVVMGKTGLVGIISKVSKNYSTIQTIMDNNSRIPIITNNSKTKGILAKQGDNLKIIYLQEEHNIDVGEVIYTSGDGKIYPQSIPVGVVTSVDKENVCVKLLEDLNDIEFVLIYDAK